MKGLSSPDGLVRSDFLGGWKNDTMNKFSSSGRNAIEEEIYTYVKKIANIRLNSSALKNGKMMQYLPENNIYTYFRFDKSETIICIMNIGKEMKDINLAKKYPEMLKNFSGATNLFTNESVDLTIEVEGESFFIGKLSR